MTLPIKSVLPAYLDPKIVRKTAARRGFIHAYDRLEARKTALVVIDMTAASVSNDPKCQNLIDPINKVAVELRRKGGVVAWVRPAPNSNMRHLERLCGANAAAAFREDANPANSRSSLFAALDVKVEDIFALKDGFSAFFPGKCDLHEKLYAHGIDHIIIAGTVTNVCCESSARDAVELGYRITMLQDGNAGHSHGLHEASLNTIYRIFGDVRSSGEIIDMIEGLQVQAYQSDTP